MTVIRWCGSGWSTLLRAAVTRSLPSRTAPWGSPTTTNEGRPTEMLTSTDTAWLSTPATEAEPTRASMDSSRKGRTSPGGGASVLC